MNKLLTIIGWALACGAIVANLWLVQNYVQYSREMTAKLDVKGEQLQVIENNYYGFLNFTRNEFKAIKNESQGRRMPFLQRLFGGNGNQLKSEPNLSEWLDPYKVREEKFD